jgi:hypothetical protein
LTTSSTWIVQPSTFTDQRGPLTEVGTSATGAGAGGAGFAGATVSLAMRWPMPTASSIPSHAAAAPPT